MQRPFRSHLVRVGFVMLSVTATGACASVDPAADTPPTSLPPLDPATLLVSTPAATSPPTTVATAPPSSAAATVPTTTTPAATTPPSDGLGDSIGVSDSVTIRVLED